MFNRVIGCFQVTLILKFSKDDFYFIKDRIFSKVVIEARFFIHFSAVAYIQPSAFIIFLFNLGIVTTRFVVTD